MARKLLSSLALVAVLALATGCVSGPRRMTRSWDDYVNQKYTENAWGVAVLQDV